MKTLTKKQADKLWGYAKGDKYAILANEEIGYCPETKEIITCCAICGEYSRVSLSKLDQ